ncbi:MAG: site-2 protease family protein [Clostridia bacterium]|nr:site-2 protease family protein [Clostridia bacterium]
MLVAILLFGLVIFIHEFGHFICAKWSGVKVNEFAIGMGPALFKFKKGETLYALRLFPIGGYVSMEGEDAESPDERSFGKAKVWKRMIIVVAGAIMNLLLGLLLIGFYLGVSGDLTEPVVAKFADNSTSQNYGLQLGDEITDINGMRIITTLDFSLAISRDTDGVVDMVVKRDGEKIELQGIKFDMKEYEDGQKMIRLDFLIQGLENNFWNVLKHSFKWTASMARLVWISLADLITGNVSFSELSGPIGIVSIVADSARSMWQDVAPILYIMAFITINIGTMNLLPFPALDGARFLILIIEAIRRKPMKPKYEGIIHGVGLIILLGFMLIVSVSDVTKFFRG